MPHELPHTPTTFRQESRGARSHRRKKLCTPVEARQQAAASLGSGRIAEEASRWAWARGVASLASILGVQSQRALHKRASAPRPSAQTYSLKQGSQHEI